MTYRPDIDGLRALAVSVVIIFHLNPTFMPGGFIGVDVFFIISGYLITKLILSEIRKTNTFNFGYFYLRRLKRLFPALFVTTIVTSVLTFLFFPEVLKDTLNEVVYTFSALSNIYFWSKQGYFDTEGAPKLLLHTWSLSVEEQFYLLWPALLITSYKLLKSSNNIVIVILMAGLISFIVGNTYINDGKHSTVFYWMPFRTFEFALGAATIWIERYKVQTPTNSILLLLGVTLIVLSSFWINSGTNFPSYAFLFPSIGTILVIWCGQSKAGAILSNPLSVWAGKISYSAYLVHWPMIVFTGLAGYAIGVTLGIVIFLGTFGLALAMYFIVEQPFRRIKSDSKTFSGPLSLASVTLICATLVIIFTVREQTNNTKSSMFGFEQIVKDGHGYTWRESKKLPHAWSSTNNEKILIVGDSQAADFINVILKFDPHLKDSIRFFSSSKHCQIKYSDNFYTSGEYLDKYIPSDKELERCKDDRVRFAKDKRVETAEKIVISYAWFTSSLKYLKNDISEIKSRNSSAEIYIVGSKHLPLKSIKYLEIGLDQNEAELEARRLSMKEVNDINTYLSSIPGTTYLNTYGLLCEATRCRIATPSGYPIFFDNRHFTEIGSKYIAQSRYFFILIAKKLGLNAS